MTARPTSVDQLPLILTPDDVALVLGVSVKTVRSYSKRYGMTKRKGVGLRVSRSVFCRKFGLSA